MINNNILENPEEVGINITDLKNIVRVLNDQVNNGLHTGVQLYIARKGKTVLDIALGEAKPKILMQPDSVLLLWSSGKPWTSVGIAQLWEKGKLDLDQTIKEFIPEFKNGKESCTIKHILIHMGGFPMTNYSKWLTASWDDLISDACKEKAKYTPGTQCGYHPRMSWMVLGEILQRIDGRRIEDYLREEIFIPLGMDSTFMGITKERATKLGDRIALKDSPSPSEQEHLWVNNFEGRIFPGSTGYSTANDMGKFYRALWNGGECGGNRILERETVKYFTATHRKGIIDSTLQGTYSWGLGFGKGKYNSKFCSEDAFGHGGRSSCINFCDPQLDLIVNFNSNTMLPAERHLIRRDEIISRIYEACRYKF